MAGNNVNSRVVNERFECCDFGDQPITEQEICRAVKEGRVTYEWADEMESEDRNMSIEAVTRTETYPPPLTRKNEAEKVSKPFSYASAVTGEIPRRPMNNEMGFLPSHINWSKYVVIQCTTEVKPIYITDVLEAVGKKIDTSQIISVGPFRAPHIFLMEMKTAAAKEKILACSDIKVAGKDVTITMAQENHITVTLVNIPHAIGQIDVDQALSPWGNIIRSQHMYSQDPRFSNIIINRRKIVLKIHNDINVEEFPHMLTIASFRIPCFVAGRPPKCYGCGKPGHFHNMCPVMTNNAQKKQQSQTKTIRGMEAVEQENIMTSSGGQNVDKTKNSEHALRDGRNTKQAKSVENKQHTLIPQKGGDEEQATTNRIEKIETAKMTEQLQNVVKEVHEIHTTTNVVEASQMKRHSDEQDERGGSGKPANTTRDDKTNGVVNTSSGYDPEAVTPAKKKQKKIKKKERKGANQMEVQVGETSSAKEEYENESQMDGVTEQLNRRTVHTISDEESTGHDTV